MKGVDSLEVESRIVREALKRCVATHLGWNPKDMEIRRTEAGSRPGPPRLYYQGKKTTLILSLSHDGHFGGLRRAHRGPERTRGAQACRHRVRAGETVSLKTKDKNGYKRGRAQRPSPLLSFIRSCLKTYLSDYTYLLLLQDGHTR